MIPAFCSLLKSDAFIVYNSKAIEQRNSIAHQCEHFFYLKLKIKTDNKRFHSFICINTEKKHGNVKEIVSFASSWIHSLRVFLRHWVKSGKFSEESFVLYTKINLEWITPPPPPLPSFLDLLPHYALPTH